MTGFRVRRDFGKGINLGIAVPGFDGSKWPTSNKYSFTLSSEEVKDLMEKLREVTEGMDK